jgi:hypothetical protein
MKHIPYLVSVSRSHSQGIPRFVSTPNIQYDFNKNIPIHPISTLLKSFPIITTYLFKKNFAIAFRMWSGIVKERGNLLYVGTYGKIILKYIVKK